MSDMAEPIASVTDTAELYAALNSGAKEIQISGEIRGLPMLPLPEGVRLRGGTLGFNAKGVRLSQNNILENIRIETQEHEAAILNDTGVTDLGNLTLRNVTTVGQVLLLARDNVRSGHIEVNNLRIEAADVRGRIDRPYGWFPGYIEIQQGGFTLWNMQKDPEIKITAELLDISAGTADHPIRGTGVMVSGHGVYNGIGGTLEISTLRTGAIHVNSGIIPLTADLISGGVFVCAGAHIKDVINAGEVISYGDNQPVLDNWGSVTTWLVEKPITTHGLSGVGFVHFGDLDLLDVRAPITTFGVGGRGFNLYDGTIRRAVFESITTHGDGGVGIVVSKDLAELEVRGDLTTLGGEGHSLYRGMQIPLKATALDVKAAGHIGSIVVGGSIVTKGTNVTTVSIEGTIGSIRVKNGIRAEGKGSDALHLTHAIPGLNETIVSAVDGQAIVWLQSGHSTDAPLPLTQAPTGKIGAYSGGSAGVGSASDDEEPAEGPFQPPRS